MTGMGLEAKGKGRGTRRFCMQWGPRPQKDRMSCVSNKGSMRPDRSKGLADCTPVHTNTIAASA